MSERINLGDKVRHAITGFEGIATAKVQYLTGCDQVCIQPQGLKPDGDYFDSRYFDEPYVDLVESEVVPNRTPGRVTGASKSPGRSGDAQPPR